MHAMQWLELVVSAVLTGGLSYLAYFVISQSIKMPRERTIQVITRFGKFYAAIMSVEGHRFNDPRRPDFFDENIPAWEIVPADEDYEPSLSEKWNIYLFLWPFFKTYVYPFAYLKLKRKGDVQDGDHVIWNSDDTGESLVARSGTSDFIDFHHEYPTITGDLFTKGMAKVRVFTNNTLQATNPYKMLFGINNWLSVVSEKMSAALKGIVADLSLMELNQVKSESNPGTQTPTADFTDNMNHINSGAAGIMMMYGVQLTRSIFKTFEPADENTRTLMASFLKPQIATQEGDAAKIKADLEGQATITTAEAKAVAYGKEQKAIVDWRKKYLVDTGLAKVDGAGNIIELVPDANVRVSAEAIRELSNLKGTLMMGGRDALSTVLAITPTTEGAGAPS
jgi:regulator of protease activity HflC (stomatin/prohibitin superfamily)